MKAKYILWMCLTWIAAALVVNAFPTRAAPAGPQAAPAVPEAAGYLTQVWKTGIWGTGIGASGISSLDIDGDAQSEIVLGGGYESGANKFWYILSYDSASGDYWQEWLSDEYTGLNITRLAVADPEGLGEYSIYVALSDSSVEVYDAATRQLLDTFTAPYAVAAMTFADVDGDGEQEIAASGASGLAVLDALTYQVEWQDGLLGSLELAVGNVDLDPALELVTASRVLDGVTHAVEWNYPSTFGALVRLADLDADSLAEIIAVLGGTNITAYDGDTQTVKWTLPVTLAVAALYVGDIDSDPAQEVVVGDGGWGNIHAYDSLTLLEEWSIANPDHGVTDLAFGDPDDDGTREALWGAGWSSTGPDHLYVGNVITTSLGIEWQSVDIGGPLTALDTGDVDDDGDEEIVMVSYDSESGSDSGIIFVYDALTYALEWRSDPLLSGQALPGAEALALADVDEDGVLEIVIATALDSDGLILAYDGLSHILDWQTAAYADTVFAALEIVDSDNDSHLEVIGGQKGLVAGGQEIYVRIFNGLNGAEEWHTDALGLEAAAYDIAVGNTDLDANPEILVSVDAGRVSLYDGVTHAQEWQSTTTTGKGVAMADIDLDGQTELLLGTTDGSIAAYDGLTFEFEWSLPVSGAPVNALRLDDPDNDSTQELSVCDDHYLYVYEGLSRELIATSDLLGSSACAHGQLAVADIDGDNYNEAVLGSHYALYVLRYASLAFSSSLDVNQTLSVPGAVLTYTIEAENLFEPALPVLVSDTLPADTTFVPGSLWASAGTWGLAGGVVEWEIDLEQGEAAELTFAVTVNSGVTDGTLIEDTANFSAGGFSERREVSTIIDALPPATTISQPQAGEIVSGSSYTIRGSSVDAVAGVESVEVDIGGSGWQPATGTTNWEEAWTLPVADTWVTIAARATDVLGQVESPGASVTVFVDNLSPYLTSASPADGAEEVLLDEPLVVSFSEPVVPATFSIDCQPDPGGWELTVSPDGRTYTLEHDPFDQNAAHTCTAAAQDGAGHTLVAGDVPNPWGFSTIETIFPVTGVTISGPAQVEPGELIILTAQSVPSTATTPLDYVWDTDGQLPYTHTAGLTDRAYFRFDTPGTRVITLSVSNSVSSAYDTFQIVVKGPTDLFIPLVTKSGGVLTGHTGGRVRGLLMD